MSGTKNKTWTWRQSPLDKFMGKISPEPNSGCWLWTDSLRNGGYGCIEINSRTHAAHRFSYSLFRGDIPSGLSVLHKCDVRSCVNPDHLFLGTQQDNIDDCILKGRFARGIMRRSAKLSEASVLAIRASSERSDVLAKTFGISLRSVNLIRSRSTWRHL